MSQEPAPTSSPTPGPATGSERPVQPVPGERRLDRPPSDRYRPTPDAATAHATAGSVTAAASMTRAVLYGSITAVIGVVIIVLLGGVLTLSGGLLAVAVVIGRTVGLGVVFGGGVEVGQPTRTWLAIGLALASVAVGQIGLWLYGRTEGGVLDPLDYLWQVFGPLVLFELVIAAFVAAWTAR